MKVRKEFIIGLITSVAVVGLIVGFFFLKGQEIWKDRQVYYVIFEKADGLSTGSQVKFKGVSVGKVIKVGLHPLKPMLTLVEFEVSEPLIRIPENSTALLGSDLLGTGYISLIYTDSDNYHSSGDTLVPDVEADLKSEIDKKFEPLMLKINDLVGTAEVAVTTIRAVFSNNTENLNESFEGLKRAINNFEVISDTLRRVLNDFSGTGDRVTLMLNNINAITGNLKKSNEQITNTLVNLSNITDSISKIELSATVNQAKRALETVNLILDEVQYGDGTLTRLMQDSLLYVNMNIMLDEATRLVENIKEHPNRYLQFAIFGSKDKGLKLDNREEKQLRKFVKDSLMPKKN